MLKGHVFSEQLFHNECFAHFINLFLNKKNGVTKGCNITSTNNTITVNAGYFCVQGRFLEVVGSDTLQITPNTEYCKLVCEIDLSQTNTETQFNQASFKILTGTSSYPTLTKQDLENGGSIYQFEFAQFQNTTSGIKNFKDTREILILESIYTGMREEYREVLRQLQQELANVKSGTVLKTNLTITKDDGKVDLTIRKSGNIVKIDVITTMYANNDAVIIVSPNLEIPDWAKVSDNTTEYSILDRNINLSDFSALTSGAFGFSGFSKSSIEKNNTNGHYRLVVMAGVPTAQDREITFENFLTYITD